MAKKKVNWRATETIAGLIIEGDLTVTGEQTYTGAIGLDGVLTQSDTTDASGVGTGSINTLGGISATKKVYVGTDLVMVAGDIDLSSATSGTYDLILKDAVADALSIRRATTDMVVFNTSTPLITVTPATTVTGALTANGGIAIGACTTGINISGACTTAINVSAVQTDETGLEVACLFQHGAYSTALAYGTQTAHLIMNQMHISAAATGVYVFGHINRITTSAVSTGYMNVSYDYLSVGHNLVNGWATRGRVDITETSQLGEMAALLGTLDVAANKAVTATGAATLSACILDTQVNAGATVAQEVTCLEVRPHIKANIAGSSCGIRININCSSVNYVDFGLDIRSMSAQQTAAIRILATPASDSLPCGIHIEGQNSSSSWVTSAMKLAGRVAYLVDFTDMEGEGVTYAYDKGNEATSIAGAIRIKDSDGSTKYINVWSTRN